MPAKRTPRNTPNNCSTSPAEALAHTLTARDLDSLIAAVPTQVAAMTGATLAALYAGQGGARRVLASSGEPEAQNELTLPLVVEGQAPMELVCRREAPFEDAEREAVAMYLENVKGLWRALADAEAARHQLEAATAELRQETEKVGQLKEQLSASEKLKAQFVATMSHELRTPLNVVLGFGSLLADEAFGPLNPDQGEACQKIMESTERLALLINDLLDFSKLQAYTLEFNYAPVAVQHLVEKSLEAMRPLAERKALKLELELAANLPKIRADQDRVEQSLKHLLDNAIKFTPEGGTVGVRAHEETGDVIIEVWDTGIGIPPEAQHRLFDRFYQVDSSNTRLYGGTGIGLALVKELVERHGGAVSVESKVGKGSTFRIALPVAGVPTGDMKAVRR